MARPREAYLIGAVVALSAVAIAAMELRPYGYVGTDVSRIVIYLVVALNLIVAAWGLLGAHRWWWAAYLVVSGAGIVQLAAATPIVALYLIWASHLCGSCG